MEKAEQEVPQARVLNAVARQVMAEEALRLGFNLVHYSTDNVFDGKSSTPYKEIDPPNPIDPYGQTKLEDE